MFGVLLLHSLFSTDLEMKEFSEYLKNQGLRTLSPLLPGHGVEPLELENYSYKDWINAAEDSLQKLNSICQVTFVVGQVTSAPIALSLAASHPELLGVVILSGILTPTRKQSIMKHTLRFLPRMIPWASDDSELEFSEHTLGIMKNLKAYDRVPKKALYELDDLLRTTRKLLKNINQPIYIMYASLSKNVDPRNSQIIFNEVNSPKKKLLSLERGGGLMSVDEARHIVFREASSFFWACIDLYQM
ncbi:MAG: alpha/beta hydrolase [Candidatus Hodarchaeales archaeon]|jgi:carboxylesterase